MKLGCAKKSFFTFRSYKKWGDSNFGCAKSEARTNLQFLVVIYLTNESRRRERERTPKGWYLQGEESVQVEGKVELED